ncbi:type IV pilus assembly protein PilM [Sporomusa carbonis]|uniref:type IV pilus assembly protein PilM n=1 Tax=Sporomusa carbonis TaxID=3076075 RepID=UPI003C7AEA9C
MKISKFALVKDKVARWLVRRPTNIVGIDIGSGAVKMAEVAIQQDTPLLKAVGIAELPENILEDGYVADIPALAGVLNRLLNTSGIGAQAAVMAVSGRNVFVREVMFPAMSYEELREAIKWDMEKYVPYDPDSYYYDFAIAGTGKTELEIKVLLVAAPNDLINGLVAAVKEAGCKPIAVEIEPLALQRTIPGAANCLVIDIGDSVSQIHVFQSGSPSITRPIPLGGRRFTEVIMSALDLEFTEAERLKQRQMGLLQRVDYEGERSFLHQQLFFVVEELAREVRRTYEYYQIQNREAIVEKIILTGGGAKLDNLAHHLAAQLEDIQVILHNPLAGIGISPSLDAGYVGEIDLRLAMPIGLALRGGEP